MGATAAAIVAVVGGVTKAVVEAKKAKKAQQAIEEYNRQQLKTVTEDLTISRQASDLQREELARTTATSIGALQAGGARTLMGGIGTVNQQAGLKSREIAAGIEKEQKILNILMSQDRARVQGLMEQREREDLAGLGQQMAVSNQNMWGGIVGAATGLVSGISGLRGDGSSSENSSSSNYDFGLKDFNDAATSLKTGSAYYETAGVNPFGSNEFLIGK